MQHNPLPHPPDQPVPPPDQWPLPYGPDCPACDVPDSVGWLRTGTCPLTGAALLWWVCRYCRLDWTTRQTHWPVLDGPDCPTCQRADTVWAAIEPDHPGDLWTCPVGHEFVLTPEGIVTPVTRPGEGS